MGDTIQLIAADGHQFAAYLAKPSGAPKGGLVVCQEIFGVNGHIRGVVDRYAEAGYLAVAPALFDRAEREVELGYDADDVSAGRALRGEIDWEQALADVAVSLDAVAAGGKIGVVGYCWGGSVAWLAACRLPLAAAVCYYGGQINDFRDEKPGCPAMLHFGEEDGQIPPEHVAAIRAARPEVEVFTYPAGHGFNCDQRGSYHAASAAQALERSHAFFGEHLG